MMEKVALQRLVKELAKGTVKTPLDTLVQKAGLRSANTYAAGMKKGNKYLQKLQGTPITVPKPGTFQQHLTEDAGGGLALPNPEKNRIDVLLNRKISRLAGKNERELVARHELFEAGEVKKHMKTGPIKAMRQPKVDRLPAVLTDKFLSTHDRFATKRSVVRPQVFRKDNEVIGVHMNPSILTRESNVVRSNPYLHNSVLIKHRVSDGEGQLVQHITGKKYGVDKMTGKDHARAQVYNAGKDIDIP